LAVSTTRIIEHTCFADTQIQKSTFHKFLAILKKRDKRMKKVCATKITEQSVESVFTLSNTLVSPIFMSIVAPCLTYLMSCDYYLSHSLRDKFYKNVSNMEDEIK